MEANLDGIKKIYNFNQEPRKKFMTMTDSLNLMIRDTQLGIGEKEAIYCYGMSKMSVVMEQENMGQYKILKLVELLEMIGRVHSHRPRSSGGRSTPLGTLTLY